MARKKHGQPDDPWGDNPWGEVERAPRAGVDSTQRLVRRARFYKWGVWAIIVLFPIQVIGSLAMVTALLDAGSASETDQVDPAARVAATLAVRDWLNTSNPVPSGTLVSWDGHEVIAQDLTEGSATYGLTWQLHTLTIRDNLARLYTAQVTVLLAGPGRAQAQDVPALVPRPPGESLASDTTRWPAGSSASVSGPVTTAVSTWASAFVSGDPGALRQAVGDRDVTRSYMPLVGVVDHQVRVVRAVSVMNGTTPVTDQMIVAVQLDVTWADESVGTIGFDLLVHAADTGAPNVVAWGAPGAGTTLVAYANAVPGALAAGDLPSGPPTPEPTVEPVPTQEPAPPVAPEPQPEPTEPAQGEEPAP